MADHPRIREASHAGSWYSASKSQLDSQLSQWLSAVETPVSGIGPQSSQLQQQDVPVAGARMIIAPHAGYAYSGPAAAWAYKLWDLSKAKRIFLLGPSHHYSLAKAALSKCDQYATPLGNLIVDRDISKSLHSRGQFEWMSQSVDEDEHSLEMHLPYIYKMLSTHFGSDPSQFPLLVPIMVGHTSRSAERTIGRLLAPYLADPSNVFVVSSDFAHWGSRFRYTYYRPASGPAVNLSGSSRSPKDPAIHESIKAVDFECIAACESGSHDAWLRTLEDTGNTVCGRHPIGVMMAAVEEITKGKTGEDAASLDSGRFKFVRYERSSDVKQVSDSSVSYASAFAVL